MSDFFSPPQVSDFQSSGWTLYQPWWNQTLAPELLARPQPLGKKTWCGLILFHSCKAASWVQDFWPFPLIPPFEQSLKGKGGRSVLIQYCCGKPGREEDVPIHHFRENLTWFQEQFKRSRPVWLVGHLRTKHLHSCYLASRLPKNESKPDGRSSLCRIR